MLQRRVLSRRRLLVAGICVLAVGTALFGLVARLPTRAAFIGVCLALRLTEGAQQDPHSGRDSAARACKRGTAVRKDRVPG